MKSMTWTLRLAVSTAAMLALMSTVAQAKPTAYVGTYRPTPAVASAPTAVPDRVDKIGTDQQRPVPVTTFVVRTTDSGFDWIDAVIGAGSAVAIMLIGAAALSAHGRRRVALSA